MRPKKPAIETAKMRKLRQRRASCSRPLGGLVLLGQQQPPQQQFHMLLMKQLRLMMENRGKSQYAG